MGEILLDEQGFPAAPAAGQMLLWPDSSSSQWMQRNDAGQIQGDAERAATAAQALAAADTYVTNSGLQIPSFGMQAGMTLEWWMLITKTAAGVAAPIYQVRIGAAQTTADTSRLSITGPAQSAVVDACELRIRVTCRSVGVAGVLQGGIKLHHNLAATGFAVTGPAGVAFTDGTSAGFDNTATIAGQFVGLSINAGAAAAWTITQAIARLKM